MTVTEFFKKIENGEDAILCCVGDSITYGLNHCLAEETYTAKLAVQFGFKYPDTAVLRYDGNCTDNAYDPINGYTGPILVHSGEKGRLTVIRNGIGGNTVARLINRIDDFTVLLPDGVKPDVITVMVGINDALSEDANKYVTPEQFKLNYRKLLNLLAERLPDTAVVLLTPSYNDNGLCEKSRLEPYCDAVKLLAKEYSLPLIDVHSLWMKHLIIGSNHFGQREWLSNSKYDACHPTPLGAEMTARYIFDSMTDLSGGGKEDLK